MTYNIQDGGGERSDLIARVIELADPDVALLNEADNPAVVEWLASRLGYRHLWSEGSGDKHIALLSRVPIRGWHGYNRRPITQALLAVTLETTADGGRRTAEAGSAVTLYGVHLMPYFMLLPYEWARWRTVRAVLRLIQREPPHPHLVLGDFNAARSGEPADTALFPPARQRQLRMQFGWQPRFALGPLLRAGYVDCYRSLNGQDAGWTWMPSNPSARLDYIFADPSMAQRLRACDIWRAPPAERASDHYPLVAEFG